MNTRIMRVIVFFDLPTITSKNMTDYRIFRNFLIKNGFMMLQESIYCRLMLNTSSSELLKKQLRDNVPPEGLVQMLTITEKQFANIEFLVGTSKSTVLDSIKRVVEL